MLEAHSLFRGYGKAKKANFSTYIVQLYSSEQAGKSNFYCLAAIPQRIQKNFRHVMEGYGKTESHQAVSQTSLFYEEN